MRYSEPAMLVLIGWIAVGRRTLAAAKKNGRSGYKFIFSPSAA
jgi:hypothetical protein